MIEFLDFFVWGGGSFPAEQIPDGDIFTTHHYTYGMILALLGVWVVSDNKPKREPFITMVAILAGLFAFLFGWPNWHIGGALVALVAPFIAMGFVWIGPLMKYFEGTIIPRFAGWEEYPVRWQIWTTFWLLYASDDSINHALGIPTPLDHIWSILVYGGV